MTAMKTISYDEFTAVELRAGTIIAVEAFPEARNPAYKLQVDFGECGVLWSSTQITTRYPDSAALIGTQVIGAINLGDKKIGPFISQFLTTGFKDRDGEIVLARPDRPVPNGEKLL